MSVELKNMMEEIVLEKLDEIIGLLGCCTCEQCRIDIASYVLNRVPPKYTASVKGEVMSKFEGKDNSFETGLVKEITKAAQVIGKNPHHRDNSSDKLS